MERKYSLPTHFFPLVAGLRSFQSSVNGLNAAKAAGQPIKPDVHHRSGVKREQLANQQSSDDANAEWLAQLRTGAATHGQRQSPKERGHGGHHDGPEAQETGLIYGHIGRQVFSSFGFESEIDHHDG